jgi:transcriptional regulator of heat shock response
LSNALLSTELADKEKSLFLFHNGTANLLKGNFETAKEKLRESLKNMTDEKIKGFALNNLGVACWWHK